MHSGKMQVSGEELTILARNIKAHIGVNTLQRQLSQRFYWPRMSIDAKNFILSCERCQKVHQVKIQKPKTVLHPVKIPNEVWQQVGIDLIELPEIDGYNFVLTAIDYFSKWVEIYPLRGKSAKGVAEALFDVIMRWGPAKIHITGIYFGIYLVSNQVEK